MSTELNVVYPDLKDKIILVTGATRGIGRAIALELARQQAHVVFNYRKEESQAEELKEQIHLLGGKASYLKFDVANIPETQAAIKEFTAHNIISGLVNNAGVSKDNLILRLKEEELDHILDTNLKGAIMLTQALSRNFLKATNVSIVNMSSVVGLMGNAAQTAYAASKAGLIGFTKSLARELSSRNVRVNAICPGFISSDMTAQLDEKVIESYKSQIPLGRFGSAEDVARLTSFLLSQASSYVTGQAIKIDGGLYI